MVVGVDPRTLPIGPKEAFVLSLIDGASDVDEIALATGIERESVQGTLRRLRDLGAVVYREGGRVPRADPVPARDGTAPGQGPRPLARPVTESAERTASIPHPSAPRHDPVELDEACDLDLDRKRAILDLYSRLDRLDHYELLDIRPDAEKSEIKAAYYRVVGRFHPDKYFGKNLGGFRAKLERVFARLTEAHDVLTRRSTRRAYDESLRAKRRTHDPDRSLRGSAAAGGAVERAHQPLPEEVRRANATEREGTGETVTAPEPAPEPPVGAATRPRAASPQPPPACLDPAERRRALARKLGGSVPPPASPPTPMPEDPSERPRLERPEELLRLLASRATRARDEQVRLYLDAAEVALKEGNPLSATNTLRVALALAPDREDVIRRLAEAEHAAHLAAADSHLEQGAQEESEQRWEEAARSYQLAARGKPTARVHDRTATCLLNAQGDLKVALEHARAAVNLAPTLAGYRVTLAQVYLAANMRQSAVAELERAQALAPQDDTIRSQLRRVRRNQV